MRHDMSSWLKFIIPCFADHPILIMLQRANGNDGLGQNRRREGSDGDISSPVRWQVGSQSLARAVQPGSPPWTDTAEIWAQSLALFWGVSPDVFAS